MTQTKPQPRIRDLSTRPDMPWDVIEKGDHVRSFDFPWDSRDLVGERATYIEGIVTDFIHWQGCDRYKIRVTRKLVGGEDVEVGEDWGEVMPPVNGTPTLLGSVCSGVEKIIDN